MASAGKQEHRKESKIYKFPIFAVKRFFWEAVGEKIKFRTKSITSQREGSASINLNFVPQDESYTHSNTGSTCLCLVRNFFGLFSKRARENILKHGLKNK